MNKRNSRHHLAGLTSTAMLGVGLAISAIPGYAQETEVEMLRRQINELSVRLQKLEEAQAATKATPTPAPTATPAPANVPAPSPPVQTNTKTPLQIGGVLHQQANAFFNQKNAPGTSANPDTFRLRRAQIRLTMPRVTDRLAATLMFDLAKTDNRTRAGSVLQEMILSYNVDKNAKSPKFIDFGQFKPGFGYEGDVVLAWQLQMIERSQLYNFRDLAMIQTSPPTPGLTGGGLGNIRDQGIRLRGTVSDGQLGYSLGLFNGMGEILNDTAKGDLKVVTAKLTYMPKNTGWRLGVSGMTGNSRNVATGGPIDRNAYNFFAVYKKNKFNFESEYTNLNSNLQRTPSTRRDGEGYYLHAGYYIAPRVELTGRYDSFTQRLTAGEGTSVETTLGANYYIKDKTTRIQVNLVKADGEANALIPFDSYQLRTQFQLAY